MANLGEIDHSATKKPALLVAFNHKAGLLRIFSQHTLLSLESKISYYTSDGGPE